MVTIAEGFEPVYGGLAEGFEPVDMMAESKEVDQATPDPVKADRIVLGGFMQDSDKATTDAVTKSLSNDEQESATAKGFYENKQGKPLDGQLVQSNIEYEYGEGATATTANASNKAAAGYRRDWLMMKMVDPKTGTVIEYPISMGLGAPPDPTKYRRAEGGIVNALGAQLESWKIVMKMSPEWFTTAMNQIGLSPNLGDDNANPASVEQWTKYQENLSVAMGQIEESETFQSLRESTLENMKKRQEYTERFRGTETRPMIESIKEKNWTRLGADIMDSFAMELPNFVTIMGLGAVHPSLGLAYAGGSSGADRYAQGIADGESPDEASRAAAIFATSEVLFEMGGSVGMLSGMMKRQGRKEVLVGFTRRALELARDPGSEIGTQIVQNLTDGRPWNESLTEAGIIGLGFGASIMGFDAKRAVSLGDATRMNKQNTPEEIEQIIADEPALSSAPEAAREALTNPTIENVKVLNDEIFAEEEATEENADEPLPTQEAFEEQIQEIYREQAAVEREWDKIDNKESEKAMKLWKRLGDLKKQSIDLVDQKVTAKNHPPIQTEQPAPITTPEGRAVRVVEEEAIPETPETVVTPEIAGMGDVVGISREENNKLRNALGETELDETAREKQVDTLQQATDEGIVDLADTLATVIDKTPRELEAKEVAGMLMRKAQLVNQIEAAQGRVSVAEKAGDIESMQMAVEEVSDATHKALTLTRAVTKGAAKNAGKNLAERVAKEIKEIRAQAYERAEVTEAIKGLERLINHPDVPKVVRARLRGYGKLAERKTTQGKIKWIEHMANRIDDEMVKYARTENLNSLRKTLNPFATEYSPNRMKLKKRVGEEARLELNYAIKLMKNSDAVAPKVITTERAEELVETFGDVGARNSNPTRVKEALEAAHAIIDGGRTARQEFVEARRERNEEVAALVRDVVLNGSAPVGEATIQSKEGSTPKVVKALNYLNATLIRPMEGFQQQLNKMDRIKGGELEGRFLGKTFEADQEEVAMNTENMERTNDDLQRVLGRDDRKASSWYRDSTKYYETDIEWRDNVDAGMEKRTLTKQQGVSLLMQWHDKSLRTTFDRMGIDEATIKQVEEFVGRQGVAMAHYIRNRYAEQGIDLQAKFMEIEGVPLDIIDGYGGRARRTNSEGVKQEDMQMFATGPTGRPTVKSGSMKERTNSTDFLLFNEVMKDFTQHTREVNHYISHAELAKDLQAAFINNKASELAIRQKYGTDFYNSLKSQIDYIVEGDPLMHSKADKLMNSMRSGITKAQLMGKLSILVKQLASTPAFIEEIGVSDYNNAIAQLARNPKKWMGKVWQSQYVKNRMSTSQFADVRQDLEQRDNTLRGLNISDYVMMNVRYGDIGAVVAGGTPIYIDAYNKAKAKGASDTQAELKAEEVFGLASERAQQASASHSKGEFLRGSGLARTFFMYMTSPLQYQRNINTSIINLVENVSEAKQGSKAEVKKSAKQALRAVMIYHVVLPQIFQAIASGLVGFTDDEDDVIKQFWARQRRALYMGNLNTFPIVGQIISVLLNKASGANESFRSTGSPALDLMGEVRDDVSRVAKNADDLTAWYKLAEDIVKPVGIPAETGRRTMEAIEDIKEDDTDHPFLRAMGWSSWSLMED